MREEVKASILERIRATVGEKATIIEHDGIIIVTTSPLSTEAVQLICDKTKLSELVTPSHIPIVIHQPTLEMDFVDLELRALASLRGCSRQEAQQANFRESYAGLPFPSGNWPSLIRQDRDLMALPSPPIDTPAKPNKIPQKGQPQPSPWARGKKRR